MVKEDKDRERRENAGRRAGGPQVWRGPGWQCHPWGQRARYADSAPSGVADSHEQTESS